MSVGSHTIPRFYLEQFANPTRGKGKSGKVWVYQKGMQAQLRATRAQGYENGYFGYVRPDGSVDESLEERLGKLEYECNDILVCSKSELCDLRSLANRNRLAFYVTLLFQRSTSRRKFSAGNWLKIKEPYLKLASNEEYVRDVAAHFSESAGEQITPEQISEMIQNQAAQFAREDVIKNTFLAELLLNVEGIKRELVSKPWQVWQAPSGAEFVTSDNPLVTFLPITEEVWHPGHGFHRPGVVVAFPLAPTACLMMGIVGKEFKSVSEATVMRLNDIVIRASDRFVYAKTPDEKIAKMVEEVGGTSVPGKNAFVGAYPDEKRIEEHLRSAMRIRRRPAK